MNSGNAMAVDDSNQTPIRLETLHSSPDPTIHHNSVVDASMSPVATHTTPWSKKSNSAYEAQGSNYTSSVVYIQSPAITHTKALHRSEDCSRNAEDDNAFLLQLTT
ncbi:hypothetical protein HanXRQr2_Chr17g0819511 [Helianthus annuus]|uniref:Uncharacterized protein n=1 Tax=Helianthus annuus TaxID=4232 RepID=A0A9K3GVC3_HELAN|nr:hypothetical protein HanXRQr2_Chr17g0819511 [Helianthus annuus]